MTIKQGVSALLSQQPQRIPALLPEEDHGILPQDGVRHTCGPTKAVRGRQVLAAMAAGEEAKGSACVMAQTHSGQMCPPANKLDEYRMSAPCGHRQLVL